MAYDRSKSPFLAKWTFSQITTTIAHLPFQSTKSTFCLSTWVYDAQCKLDTTLFQMETCEEEVKVEPSLANPPHVVENSLAKAAEVATMDEAMTECSNTSNKIMSTAVVLASCTRTENYLEPVSVSSNGISAQAASVKVTQVSFNTGNQIPSTTPAAAAAAANCVQFRVNEVTVRNHPSSVAAPSKRKSISGDYSNSAELTKYFWSQEMATVQTTSTGNSWMISLFLYHSEVTKTRTNVQP